MKETDVILNFLEDCRDCLVKNNIVAELPAGTWVGSKNRNNGDIRGESIPSIEVKATFNEAKKDFENINKNYHIKHYIYASNNIKEHEINFWKENKVSVAIYLTSQDKWFIFETEKMFINIINQNKIYYEILGQ